MVNRSLPCLKIAYLASNLQNVNDPEAPRKVLGKLVDVIKVIMESIGRCHEWVVPRDNLYGSKLPNGSWNGIIGMVLNGEADIGNSLSITYERAQVLEFTKPLYKGEFAIAYKFPELQSDILGFVKPFAPMLWVAVLLTSVIVFCATWMILKFRSSIQWEETDDANLDEGEKEKLKTGERSLLWTMCSLINQPLPWEPVHNPGRVMGGLWLLAAFILGVVYRGNLKAMLILPRLDLPFNSLKELDESGIHLWSPGSHVAHQMLISAPPDSLHGSIAKKSFIHFRIEEGTQATFNGEYAALAALSAFILRMDSHFDQTGKCPLYNMQEQLITPLDVALGLRKGSDLKPKLDRVIAALTESGISEHIRLQGLGNGTFCTKPPKLTVTTGDLRPLDIAHFFGIFSIYAVGIALSSCVFAIELLMGRNKAQVVPNERSHVFRHPARE